MPYPVCGERHSTGLDRRRTPAPATSADSGAATPLLVRPPLRRYRYSVTYSGGAGCKRPRDSPSRGFADPPTPVSAAPRVEYPIELWERGVEGETVLKVLVARDGGVDSVVVAESSGHAELDSAAVRGAREARFEAASGDGGPVRVWTRLPVRFARSAEPPETPPGSDAQVSR